MDCKFLKSPMDGEISPPRFKLDRFLQVTSTPFIALHFIAFYKKKKSNLKQNKTYKETTERLLLSQKTPRHEQKSELCTSSQSSNTFARLLNDALIAINAFPTTTPALF